jgi:hypothetical protein
MNDNICFIQCNFSHKKNVIFEEQTFNKLVRENCFTSDYTWFDKSIVAKWRIKKANA